jgi:hypothetical protein
MAEIGAATFKCLADFGIPYDEIIFGKVRGGVMVLVCDGDGVWWLVSGVRASFISVLTRCGLIHTTQ